MRSEWREEKRRKVERVSNLVIPYSFSLLPSTPASARRFIDLAPIPVAISPLGLIWLSVFGVVDAVHVLFLVLSLSDIGVGNHRRIPRGGLLVRVPFHHGPMG
jgi:hypothetical protein